MSGVALRDPIEHVAGQPLLVAPPRAGTRHRAPAFRRRRRRPARDRRAAPIRRSLLRPAGHLCGVGADRLADRGHLVDEGHRRREEAVQGVLGHLGRLHPHPLDLARERGEQLVASSLRSLSLRTPATIRSGRRKPSSAWPSRRFSGTHAKRRPPSVRPAAAAGLELCDAPDRQLARRRSPASPREAAQAARLRCSRTHSTSARSSSSTGVSKVTQALARAGERLRVRREAQPSGAGLLAISSSSPGSDTGGPARARAPRPPRAPGSTPRTSLPASARQAAVTLPRCHRPSTPIGGRGRWLVGWHRPPAILPEGFGDQPRAHRARRDRRRRPPRSASRRSGRRRSPPCNGAPVLARRAPPRSAPTRAAQERSSAG